jgi:hypothetical protein
MRFTKNILSTFLITISTVAFAQNEDKVLAYIELKAYTKPLLAVVNFVKMPIIILVSNVKLPGRETPILIPMIEKTNVLENIMMIIPLTKTIQIF